MMIIIIIMITIVILIIIIVIIIIITVKFNRKKFSNPGFFLKEGPMNYFQDVFSTLTLPHQHEGKNNLKTQHDKENLHSF